jgi:hypothetical protein
MRKTLLFKEDMFVCVCVRHSSISPNNNRTIYLYEERKREEEEEKSEEEKWSLRVA